MLISVSLALVRDLEVRGRDRLVVGPSEYRVVGWDEKNRRLLVRYVGDPAELPSRSSVPAENLYDALGGESGVPADTSERLASVAKNSDE